MPTQKALRHRPFRWPLFTLLSILSAFSIMTHAKTSADYYVSSLPGAPTPLLKMHAGHVEVIPDHHGNLFFWHFANRHIANRQRTVIWLNGGPGCSSMDGALIEVGPYRVQKDGTLAMNPGSWDEFANLLFIDNPVGTGFSYVDTDSYEVEMDTATGHLVDFLENFFDMFPEYRDDDIYIAGESFAGQWIPYLAAALVERNKNAKYKWNVSGLLIGNGWISGIDQYLTTKQFAFKMGMLTAGSPEVKSIERQESRCVKDLSGPGLDRIDLQQCEAILTEILRTSQRNPRYKGECVNMYDIRKHDSYPSCGMNWPSDLDFVKPYLRRKDVTEALHINDDKKSGWTECSGSVSSHMHNQKSKPSKTLLPGLLAEMRIILYSGDQDLICNHLGTEELINNLEFNDGKGMEVSPGFSAPRLEWTFENEAAGVYQTARNLTYILFYNSSHMVPVDYPRRTRDMLDRFMGVDIASIGGTPADSRIDGLKGIETSVGGHTNSTAAVEAEKSRVKLATKHAYYKSGQVALMVVLIAAGVWGWVVWRGRRTRRARAQGSDGAGAYFGLGGARKRGVNDVEERDFDEAELDDLARGNDGDGFDLGSDSDDAHHDADDRAR